MRHHPTSGGASVAQNSLLHHHRAPTPWGGGGAYRHHTPRRWRTDGAMAQGHSTCRTHAEPQVWQVWQRIAEKPECGVSIVRHRLPYCSRAAGDSAEPLDSSEASTRCQAAWPSSNESTAFPEARRLHPSSHDIPMLALAPLPERIVESHQAGYGSRRAVTLTAGLVGRRHACVGPRRPREGGPTPLDAARRAGPHPGRGKTGRRSASSYLPRAITEAHGLYNFRQLSARRIEFYCENIPEKPSAASNSLEINSGRYLGMLLDFRMLENDKPL
jgi:hypothetical protein